MTLNKRFYKSTVHGLIKQVSLYDMNMVTKGFFLTKGANVLHILDPKVKPLQWRDLPLKVKIADATVAPSRAILVQVNQNEIYLLGDD
jgi:hypothetical protein